ncbi:restriction endonuclease [Candidatus Nomurabacteria bacterium]|nr:restriction endonuclease [Candidatus Nomurabacteria bacterium]
MPEILLLIVIGIIWGFVKISESVSNGSKAIQDSKKFDEERLKKFGDRKIDATQSLFERNKDIIEKHKKDVSTSESRYRYYYIDNMTRDCINEICMAEGQNKIRPNYTYLSTWKMSAPQEWKELSLQIEQIFSNRQKELKEIERKQTEVLQKEVVLSLSSKYADLMNQFNEITYRKVTTIDAYGEENWDALDKEATLLVEKIGKREGNGDDDIKRWRKSSWAMPEEYKKLSENLVIKFKDYYRIRKSKPIESGNVTEMSGIDFENHLADLLKKNGFDSVTGTPKTGDQGADLIAKRNGKTIIIQAKRYAGTVGNKAVQEVIGAINFYNGDEGWVITNSSFTKSARELANKSGIKLIDGTDMQQFSHAVNK